MAKVIRFPNSFPTIIEEENEILNSRQHTEGQIHAALFMLGSLQELRKYYDSPVTNKDVVLSDVYKFLEQYISVDSGIWNDRFYERVRNALDTGNTRKLITILIHIIGSESSPIDEAFEEDLEREACLVILINLAKSLAYVSKLKGDEEQ